MRYIKRFESTVNTKEEIVSSIKELLEDIESYTTRLNSSGYGVSLNFIYTTVSISEIFDMASELSSYTTDGFDKKIILTLSKIYCLMVFGFASPIEQTK